MNLIFTILMALFFILNTTYSRASRFIDLDGFYLPYGISAGQTESPIDGEKYYNLGAEVSYVYLDRSLFWFGAYTDFTRTFKTGENCFSIGPEFGYAIFGIDFGYIGIHHNDAGYSGGVTGRLMLTTGLLSFYVRHSRIMHEGDERLTETGVMLKFPQWMGK